MITKRHLQINENMANKIKTHQGISNNACNIGLLKTLPDVLKNMFQILSLILFLFISEKTTAQNSYQLNGINDDIGDAHIQAMEDGDYWTIQALPSGEPVTGYPVIRITEFDECGPVRAVEYTHPLIYGVLRFTQSYVDGDTVRIAMNVNPRDLHNHSEVGLLSVHKNNFGHHYLYVRADNVIIPRAFVPAGNKQYLLHSFLSYTDRPARYCTFLLDKDFNILKYYENFIEFTATGSAAKLEDGYMLATSENIYKLDTELNPVWRKKMSSRHYPGNFVKQADGVVMYIVQPSLPREIALIKIDFGGNIIWQSGNFNFNDLKIVVYRLSEKPDGNLEFVVHKFDSDSLWTDLLVAYTVDSKNGNVISTKNSFNHPLINEFRLVEFANNETGQNQFILKTPENNHILWNAVDDASCDLNDGITAIPPSEPLEIAPANMPASVGDHFQTGSYEWTRSDALPDVELICENILPFNDQLPDDTVACIEDGLLLDISNVPYEVIWGDGSTDKSKMISQSGIYTFEVNHCDISYGETINVELETCNCQFFIPNVFSPNGDQVNDFYKIYNPCESLTSFEIKIFNRWGALVFSSEDQLFGWDGTFKKEKVSSGLYTYFIIYKSIYKNEPVIEKGGIMVLR